VPSGQWALAGIVVTAKNERAAVANINLVIVVSGVAPTGKLADDHQTGVPSRDVRRCDPFP
jgi:hypothetical protein